MGEDDQESLATHKYRISEFSSHELRKLQAAVVEYKSKHPEVIGVTVFGSHTKGTARSADHPEGRSDLDSYVFIDGDLLPTESIITEMRVCPKDDDEGYKRVDNTTGKSLRKHLAERMGLDDERVEHVRLRILTQARIDNEIDVLIDWNEANNALKESRGRSDYYMPQPDLGYLFHMQLGRGLDVYRSYVLRKLKTKGDAGEEVWKNCIISAVSKTENGRIPYEIKTIRERNNLYPQTISSAIETYGLEEIDPVYKL